MSEFDGVKIFRKCKLWKIITLDPYSSAYIGAGGGVRTLREWRNHQKTLLLIVFLVSSIYQSSKKHLTINKFG